MDSKDTRKRKIKALAALAFFVLANLPASKAEDMRPALPQQDMGLAIRGSMDPFQSYPSKQQIDTGYAQKTNDCSDHGETDGEFRCVKTLSNGSYVLFLTDQENHGENFKRQVQMTEFDAQKEPQGRRTIRLKKAFTFVGSERRLRAEFFDVVNRPKGGKITREIIIYEYEPETNQLKNLTWTSYEQIEQSEFAMITRHVALAFDEDGNPLNGRAEKWKNEVPVERLFSWDRFTDGEKNLDRKAWNGWKEKIFSASPRQIF